MEVHKCYAGDLCSCLLDLKVHFRSFGLNFAPSAAFALKCYLDAPEGRLRVLHVGTCERIATPE